MKLETEMKEEGIFLNGTSTDCHANDPYYEGF